MKSGTEKIIEAYHWLQEHHNEFNKEVHGPVLLQLCILQFRKAASNNLSKNKRMDILRTNAFHINRQKVRSKAQLFIILMKNVSVESYHESKQTKNTYTLQQLKKKTALFNKPINKRHGNKGKGRSFTRIHQLQLFNT